MITRPDLDHSEMAVRYLSDRLSSREREAFEEHYLAHPKVVEEMELDAKLKAGLMSILDSNKLDRLTIVSKQISGMTPIAVAASLAVAAIAVLVFRLVAAEPILASSTAALRPPFGSQLAVAADHHSLLPKRTTRENVTIPLPEIPQAIKLQVVPDIELPIPPLAITMVAVDNASRTALVTLHELNADDNGIITLYLNSAVVRPGNYELLVYREAIPAAEVPESTFAITVTAAEDSPPPHSR